jgi:predicted RNA-binding protein
VVFLFIWIDHISKQVDSGCTFSKDPHGLETCWKATKTHFSANTLKGDGVMCEASAYIVKNGNEELVLESVDILESGDDEVNMINIFGERKTVKARIRSLSLVDHKIILEPAG